VALHRLALDEVWWLVSPQNPLKPVAGMAPLTRRLARARMVACGRRIRVTDIEARLGVRHTADSLRALRQRYPRVAFVWLMGADNLIEISRWRNWTEIFASVPVAIFDRPTYSYKALAGVAARRFARFRLPAGAAPRLARSTPPAWVFLRQRLHALSATRLRQDGRDGGAVDEERWFDPTEETR